MMRAPRLFQKLLTVSLLGGLSAFSLACGSGVPLHREVPPLTEQNRELFARTNLEHARALLLEGRLEHAESRARRGLSYEPESVPLLRLQAEVLAALGRIDEAKAHRARADALEPPPAPPPTAAHPLAEHPPATVLLLPPSKALQAEPGSADRIPQQWPEGAEARALVERVSTRLPNARLLLIDADNRPGETIPAASAYLSREAPHAALSVRIDRAYCGRSVKDGRFAVAWLRVAVGGPGTPSDPPEAHLVRVIVEDPGENCRSAAIAEAFERALELPSVQQYLAMTRTAAGGYANETTRSLLPILTWRASQEIGKGRRFLALGELALAHEPFERAVEIDPDDPFALAFLDEVDRSLLVASQLTALDPAPSLGPQLSPAQRTGLEAQLSYETKRREEMLSALAVLYETRNAPTPGTVAHMRNVEVNRPNETSADGSSEAAMAMGPALAAPRMPESGVLQAKTLFAPDGTALARYYFAEESLSPLLREDDTDGNGLPDRWVAYEEGLVREVWESNDREDAEPTLHVVYSPGGGAIERIELDHNADGDLDRVFVYSAGVLKDEAWDTNGDGSFDRFQQFDRTGSLTMREEDVNGDMEIDIRTAYNNGRIVRREILNAELLSELQ